MNEQSHQEQQLIAAILDSGDVITPRRIGVEPAALTDTTAQRALSIIYEYSQQPHSFGLVPARAYLHQHGVPITGGHDQTMGSVAGLCEAVQTAHLRRMLLAQVSQIESMATTNPRGAYELLCGASMDKNMLSIVANQQASTMKSVVEQVVKRYNDTKITGGLLGAPTPFSTLTQCTKGFHSGGLYNIFAPPKSRKTTLVLWVLTHLLKLGKRTLLVGGEMTAEEYYGMLLCMYHHLNFDQFSDRQVPNNIWADVQEDIDVFDLGPDAINWYQPEKTGQSAIAEVHAQVQRLNADGQLALVVWDGHYRAANDEEWTSIYGLVRATKRLAQGTGVPFLLTAQEGSQQGKVSHKAYEQEADGHMRLQKQGDNGILRLDRIRQGHTCVIWLNFNYKQMSVAETGALVGEDAGEGLTTA